MTGPINVYENVAKFARPYIEPLFLQDFLFLNGRSAETTTATGTFVHRKGQLYCVTCRHVVMEAREKVLALAVNSGGIMFGTPSTSCFAFPRAGYLQGDVDIAIARIPWGHWDILVRDRESLSYIDLDTLTPIKYDSFETCAAVGFPDRRKAEREGRIKFGLATAVAGLTGAINENRSDFQLFSQLDAPHGLGFSGMSGGVVLAVVGSSEFVPIGIIYEGGASGETNEPGSIFSDRDICVKAHLITREIFDDWLDRTDFPHVETEFIAII